MTALPNIPRLYTALAECLAVGIYALPLGIRFGKTATIAASAAWALALSAFLRATGSVPLAWWIPCMAAAVAMVSSATVSTSVLLHRSSFQAP